jgi:anti-sigma factor RsiW
MPAGPEQRLSPEERGNLTAYIDGELTENESRSIATKLSLSGTARRELESLRKTWELLEHLPRPSASTDFPERTLNTIRAIDAPAVTWSSDASYWTRQVLKLALCLIVAAAVFVLGFVITTWAWPDPSARLARDRSIAEHLDEYQEVGSFDFLEELARSKEFGDTSR